MAWGLNFPLSLPLKPSGFNLEARKSTTVESEISPVGMSLTDKETTNLDQTP